MSMYQKIIKYTKRTLPSSVSSFLKDSGLIPTDHESDAFKYVGNGGIGREITIRKKDPRTLYIVVEGSVRLVCTKMDWKGSSKASTISCKRKGQRTLSIKVM